MGVRALRKTLGARARYKEAMSEAANCNDCGERILWVLTVNGKRMPLDYHPERRFVIDGATMVARDRNTYVCHFNTCKRRSR